MIIVAVIILPVIRLPLAPISGMIQLRGVMSPFLIYIMAKRANLEPAIRQTSQLAHG